MTTEITTTERSELVAGRQITKEQITLAKNTVAASLNENEFHLYLFECQRRSVHPLDKLIHPLVFTDKSGARRLSFVSSIDLFRSRAEESGSYVGSEDAEFSGEPMTPAFKATVAVRKSVAGIVGTFTASARWDEYYPGESKGFQWRKMPHVMLAKCAEALALRKAFPARLSGLYEHAEMERSGDANARIVDPSTGEIQSRKVSPTVRYNIAVAFARQAGISADELGKIHAASADIHAGKFDPSEVAEKLEARTLELKSAPKLAQGSPTNDDLPTVDVSASMESASNEPAWKSHEIHFGKDKGVKLGLMDKKKLVGWIINWDPTPYKGEIKPVDQSLRDALDNAMKDPSFEWAAEKRSEKIAGTEADV